MKTVLENTENTKIILKNRNQTAPIYIYFDIYSLSVLHCTNPFLQEFEPRSFIALSTPLSLEPGLKGDNPYI